ncbi:MAG: protein-L-isoaspartate(D-aspartate) O-methyltransferase [bacterium]
MVHKTSQNSDERERALVTARERMVGQQLAGRGIRDRRVLEAMCQVPRHLFLGEHQAELAYEDTPLPIGEDQTISQPYMVALMSEQLHLEGGERVLEVGAGSGYQTAILARLAAAVFTVERIPALAEKARAVWRTLGIANVRLRIGDGTLGWLEEAPFQAILVTAGAPIVPPPLVEQLDLGGRLVIPVGERFSQTLLCLIKRPDGRVDRQESIGCRFVRLVGQHGWKAGEG